MLHNIEVLGPAQVWEGDGNCLAEMNVLVIDGKAVLNQMHKDRDMETWKISFIDTWERERVNAQSFMSNDIK